MNINKAFFVETREDGVTIIYNAGKKFFAKSGKPSGIMERFGPSEKEDKNKYIAGLIKEGWCPLSHEDIDKTRVNLCGFVTAYPFKYRKGYISIEKIETLARELKHKWKCADHDTNPFSALKDYGDFVDGLPKGSKHDAATLKKAINAFAERLSNIGAIELIENLFTELHYLPDPRRFNRTTKELWKHYRSHIKDCCRMVWDDIYSDADENFDLEVLVGNFNTIKSLQQSVSHTAYEVRQNLNAAKS